jgi:hypothetical protein
MSVTRKDSLSDLLKEWDRVVSKPQTSLPRIRVVRPALSEIPTESVRSAVSMAVTEDLKQPVVSSRRGFLPPSTNVDVAEILIADPVASVPPLPVEEAVTESESESESCPVAAIARRRRVNQISATFSEYLTFLYLEKSGQISKGFPMDKLQENNPGSVSRVCLGVDSNSVWWSHGSKRKIIPWNQIIRIEYSWTSACFLNIQKRFPEGSVQRCIPPWNCFSIITSARSFDFYDLPESVSSVSKEVVGVETGKLDIVSRDIENFLFALSYMMRGKMSVPGQFKSIQQLRLERGKMKLGYVFRDPAGRRDFFRVMQQKASVVWQHDGESGEENKGEDEEEE